MILGECMKQYFYITIHFSPEYEGTVFTKHQNNLYRNTETGEIYRKRLLYDFGWGQESGFELLPQLSFDDLIKLIECPIELPKKRFWQKYNEEQIQQANIWRNNLYGAVAVIMQDYVEELISFLSAKVDTDYFSNPSIRENFKCFSLDSEKTREEGKIPGGVLTQSYEDILKNYPEWERIASKIVGQIYGENT